MSAWRTDMLQWLSQFSTEWQILNLFGYITARTGGAALTSLAIALVLGRPAIDWLRVRQGKGQPIREDGPQSHLQSKRGTPTMGGLIILLSLCGTSLLWAGLGSSIVWIAIAVAIAFGLIGFADDLTKVRKQHHAGLSARTRLALEFAVAMAATLAVLYSGWVVTTPHTEHGLSTFARALFEGSPLTRLALPLTNSWGIQLYAAYPVLGAILIVGFGNAVNFTDGLDGLAVVPVIFVAATFALIAYLVGRADFSTYLGIPHVEGAGELAPVLGALIGGCLGFLWYNAPPARVFMGDTGSLALGGLLGVVALTTRHEIVLLVVGGLFVIETASVIAQVVYFKLTGKRIFLMAPLHHHFEKLGWSEPTIVIRFWIISAVLAILGLASLKLR